MATKNSNSDDQAFDLFGALNALDRKDYSYFDNLSEEKQRKFVPMMMTQWMSYVKGSSITQEKYVNRVNKYANKHMFNEYVYRHPKLMWMMLCAASPGVGRQDRKWIPQLSIAVRMLREPAKLADVRSYFEKIYPHASPNDIGELSKVFTDEQRKKVYLAENYPNLKLDDIDSLSKLVTEEDIKQYERDKGN